MADAIRKEKAEELARLQTGTGEINVSDVTAQFSKPTQTATVTTGNDSTQGDKPAEPKTEEPKTEEPKTEE